MKELKFYPWFENNSGKSTNLFYNNANDPQTEIYPFLISKMLNKIKDSKMDYSLRNSEDISANDQLQNKFIDQFGDMFKTMRKRYFYWINDISKTWCYVAITKETGKTQFMLHQIWFDQNNSFLTGKSDLCYFIPVDVQNNCCITLYRIDEGDKILKKLENYNYVVDINMLLKTESIATSLVEKLVKENNSSKDQNYEKLILEKDNKIKDLEKEIEDLQNYKDSYFRNLKEHAILQTTISNLKKEKEMVNQKNIFLQEKIDSLKDRLHNIEKNQRTIPHCSMDDFEICPCELERCMCGCHCFQPKHINEYDVISENLMESFLRTIF